MSELQLAFELQAACPESKRKIGPAGSVQQHFTAGCAMGHVYWCSYTMQGPVQAHAGLQAALVEQLAVYYPWGAHLASSLRRHHSCAVTSLLLERRLDKQWRKRSRLL